MYVIHEIIVGDPPLSPVVELAVSSTLDGIRHRAIALHAAGRPWDQMYLFNENSSELGLSAEWLEEWIAGTRKWPTE